MHSMKRKGSCKKTKQKQKHKLTNFTTGEACKTTDILKTPPCIQIDHRG